ncbi:ShlB/FhaC/HecB family hemolysin secretion/activation protein [Ursidibacter sp. B-7004-1]
MCLKTKHSLLAVVLANSLAVSVYANTDAGLLNQELNQRQQERVKPSGSLFDNKVAVTGGKQANEAEFTLQHIKVTDLEGNLVSEDLSHLLNNYVNKPTTLSELNLLVQRITEYYRQNNYLVARAILPPQDIENGTLLINIIKGRIDNISVQNSSRLSTTILNKISQANLKNNAYLYKSNLEKVALLLNDIQGVKPNLVIKAGQAKGSSDVVISVEDSKRFGGYLLLDNQGNKDTGQYRLSAGAQLNNLIGFGDDLKLDFLISDKANLKSARLDYSGLINGYGTKLGINASYLDYKLGGNFRDLDAEGNSSTLGAYLLHPTLRTPEFRLNTKIAFNHQVLKDDQNAVNVHQKRKSNLINISTNGSWRSTQNGITYFSLGTVFGKVNDHTNDSTQNQSKTAAFTVFQYQLTHEQALPKSFALSLGISGQVADTNLDSSQKMLLGGLYAVRGYKSGVASVDNGHILQTELKHYLPLFKESILTTSLFYDYGKGEYYKNSQHLAPNVKNDVSIQSAGIGLTLSAINNYAISATVAKTLGKKLAGNDKHQVWLSVAKTF